MSVPLSEDGSQDGARQAIHCHIYEPGSALLRRWQVQLAMHQAECPGPGKARLCGPLLQAGQA